MPDPKTSLSIGQMIDLPPVWLIGALGVGKLQSVYFFLGPQPGALLGFAAGLLIGGGVLLIALAFLEFRKHSTTVVPHLEADALITTGVFRRSRNPIYLADLMILTGFLLHWGAWLSLALVPLLMWVLEKRFIVPEENRLRRKFRATYAAYENRTRRWV